MYPDLNELPLRIGLPLLDAAINEDEDNLQNLWANLLASAMTEKGIISVIKPYIEMLKQLDVADAELLNGIFHTHLNAIVNNQTMYVNPKGSRDCVAISIATNNLERLGLIKIHQSSANSSEAKKSSAGTETSDETIIITIWFVDNENKEFLSFAISCSLTLLGFHFMRACTNKKPLPKEGGEYVPIDDRFYYPPKPSQAKD